MTARPIAEVLGLSYRETLTVLTLLAVGVAIAASWAFIETLGRVVPLVVNIALGIVVGGGVFVVFYLELQRTWPTRA